MHLDTVMTMVDDDTFTKYVGLGMLPSYTIEPGDSEKELKVTRTQPSTCTARSPPPSGIDRSRC